MADDRVQIRPLLASDLPAVLQLSTAAGWNQLEIDWARLVQLWPAGCFAATLEGVIVGTATVADYAPRLRWIGMVLVDEQHRGRGVGGALFDQAMRHATAEPGMIVGLDASDQGQPIYEKRGFQSMHDIIRLRGVGPIGTSGSNRATALAHLEDWPAIVELDRHAFGADRSALLARLRDEPGVVCRTFRDGSELHGFSFYRPGRVADYIGPVVARDEDEAASLVRGFLTDVSPSKEIFMDLPATAVPPWVGRMGFSEARRLKRMFKPASSHGEGNLDWVIAIAGLELG